MDSFDYGEVTADDVVGSFVAKRHLLKLSGILEPIQMCKNILDIVDNNNLTDSGSKGDKNECIHICRTNSPVAD
ncbi:hypothetical protein EG68_00206 [Paragonimus skrjabini miyazakii]|uniref:Uncharacterized protein n=1 Tax=Paragonimus skrjabini miyazakii TaxID=59628 RepID=A0A8S9Z6F3_9TREM|nr:hypothetical protein EG68_00206 [Paragonimus skrjabini miyazakii]